ncbi:NlpD [Oceanobacillus picturae]|uniref:NlpD n=1 Tax=Oceanobacillus picturae TaxID=171693 RepID=A0A0U9H552_9BACI|nr:NlpD [Oceanobacillus picturae]
MKKKQQNIQWYIEPMNGHKVEYLMEQSLPHNKKYPLFAKESGIFNMEEHKKAHYLLVMSKL